MKELIARIKKSAKENEQALIEIRRHLHANPELSFKEYKTAEFIEKKLSEFSIESKRVLETGIIGKVEGRNPTSKSIVLRGDIDALPIKESTGLEFESKNEGIMHACGHDVHTTCVLGAGIILSELREEFEGTVYLLFQPGEEKLPGGASLILNTGVFKEINPKYFIGQHVFPELETGKVGFKQGQYMASADEIYITVSGPGGHAALPEKTIDVIYASAQLIQNMQQIISRNAPPTVPTVLTFGKIEGKGATNVIPKDVFIEGTFRTMDEKWREVAHARMQEISAGVASSTGAQIKTEIVKGYPCLVNDSDTTIKMKKSAQEFIGSENVVDLDLRMTSEDFAFYSQQYNSCFYRLGIKSKGKKMTGLHSPEFTVDEDSMSVGVSVMAYGALQLLKD